MVYNPYSLLVSETKKIISINPINPTPNMIFLVGISVPRKFILVIRVC